MVARVYCACVKASYARAGAEGTLCSQGSMTYSALIVLSGHESADCGVQVVVHTLKSTVCASSKL